MAITIEPTRAPTSSGHRRRRRVDDPSGTCGVPGPGLDSCAVASAAARIGPASRISTPERASQSGPKDCAAAVANATPKSSVVG